MTVTRRLLLLSFALLAACSDNPHYDPTKAHHTPSGFRNLYYEDNKGFMAFMKWKWSQLFTDIPGVNDYQFTIDDSQHHLIINNTDKPSLTWIGHATFLIQFSGLNILTDPQFSQRASPFTWAGPQRVIKPALAIENLPEIDVAIISHDHYDSLDVDTVRSLAKHNSQRQLTFLVPLGMKGWFEELELDTIKVIELDWEQSHQINGINFHAEPSQHWGKRTLFDAFKRLWVSWVIEANGKKIFFAGDTGYAQHFKEIGEKYGQFELALIPIGAYEPRWFMKSYHVNPEESVKLHQDLNAKYSVAMHWGTFILTDEPLDQPPHKLKEALAKYNIPGNQFEVYQHGETRFLDGLLN